MKMTEPNLPARESNGTFYAIFRAKTNAVIPPKKDRRRKHRKEKQHESEKT